MAEIAEDEFAARALDRQGNRELDQAIQSSPGYRQSSKDVGRAFPRDASAELQHPAMARRLPIPDARRRPISSRQKNARSKVKNQVQDRMSGAQYRELARLIDSPDAWAALNDELSSCAGNAQELSESSRRRTRRIDGPIQDFEQNCGGREHVLYVRVELPHHVSQEQALDYVRQNFNVGDSMAFDRYTLAKHQMHEYEQFAEGEGVSVLIELETPRGMYLGRSAARDDTSHLLPRGMEPQVVTAAHVASYHRPDGTTGTAIVIQAKDGER